MLGPEDAMSKGNLFEPEYVLRPRIGRKTPPVRDRVPTFRASSCAGFRGTWLAPGGGPASRRRGFVAVREPLAPAVGAL